MLSYSSYHIFKVGHFGVNLSSIICLTILSTIANKDGEMGGGQILKEKRCPYYNFNP